MTERECKPESARRPDLFDKVITINVGLAIFGEALRSQGAEVIHVHWNPPAGGDEETLDLLNALL